jgi:hypothetical protein
MNHLYIQLRTDHMNQPVSSSSPTPSSSSRSLSVSSASFSPLSLHPHSDTGNNVDEKDDDKSLTQAASLYDEPIWTTAERITLYEKTIEVLKHSEYTITRKDFDQQLIEYMKTTHNTIVTSQSINKQIQSAKSNITRIRKNQKEKESEMKDWERKKADFEHRQQQERDKMMRRRRSSRNSTVLEQLPPLADFDEPCPIPPLSALAILQVDVIKHLNIISSQWEQELQQKKQRKKEERAIQRKKQRTDERTAALQQRMNTITNISTNGSSSSSSPTSNSDSPVRRNTFSIATNTKLYMDHLIDNRNAIQQMLTDLTNTITRMEQKTDAYREQKLKLREEELKLLRMQLENKENMQ